MFIAAKSPDFDEGIAQPVPAVNTQPGPENRIALGFLPLWRRRRLSIAMI
jgi:hypothetical protein